MGKFTIGPKTRMGARSLLKELPADHPVYTRGYAVGETKSKNSSGSAAEKDSQKQNEQPAESESSSDQSNQNPEWAAFQAFEQAVSKLGKDTVS